MCLSVIPVTGDCLCLKVKNYNSVFVNIYAHFFFWPTIYMHMTIDAYVVLLIGTPVVRPDFNLIRGLPPPERTNSLILH